MNTDAHIHVSRLGSAAQPLKIAVVTETYPPDINGVAHTLSKIVEGLQALGHDLWLIRPKQQAQHMAVQTAHFQEVLVKGVPIPFYNELRMGLPAKRELQRLWAKQRPDIVHIATEGPLGWSALQVARKLKLPVSTVTAITATIRPIVLLSRYSMTGRCQWIGNMISVDSDSESDARSLRVNEEERNGKKLTRAH